MKAHKNVKVLAGRQTELPPPAGSQWAGSIFRNAANASADYHGAPPRAVSTKLEPGKKVYGEFSIKEGGIPVPHFNMRRSREALKL